MNNTIELIEPEYIVFGNDYFKLPRDYSCTWTKQEDGKNIKYFKFSIFSNTPLKDSNLLFSHLFFDRHTNNIDNRQDRCVIKFTDKTSSEATYEATYGVVLSFSDGVTELILDFYITYKKEKNKEEISETAYDRFSIMDLNI